MAQAIPAVRGRTRLPAEATLDIGADPGAAPRPGQAPRRTGSRRRFFATEIGLSLIFNMVIAGVATWLLSDWPAATSGRFADAYLDIFRATIGPMTGFVVPVTLMIRKRVRLGKVPPSRGRQILPRNVVLRALVLCAVSIVVLGTPAGWLLATLAPQGAAFLLFKILYGAAIALAVTPFVLVAALRDRAPPLQGPRP